MMLRIFAAGLLAVLLAACNDGNDGGGDGGGGGGGTPSACDLTGAPVAPPAGLVLKAETALPPGQSGFFSLAGQVQGTLTGNPADFGDHVDDQRAMYWSFDAKDATLGTKPGAVTSPLAGVEIYRDAYGVPIVYAPDDPTAQNVHDLWFGVGYAVAQDRLFLMDAVRRTGRGTLSALTGCGTRHGTSASKIEADIQTRVLTYSEAEYTAMFNALSDEAKQMAQGYVDGANAWVAAINTDPSKLPAEYALLTSQVQPFTVNDVLAAGVYITRFVASEGGNEFSNIEMLKKLEARFGSRAEALKAFQDLTWLEDRKAATTVPLSEGEFSNQPVPPEGRDAVFATMAAWALDPNQVPDTVRRGPGSGDYGRPASCDVTGAAGLPPLVKAGKVRRALEQRRSQMARLDEGLGNLIEKPRGGASWAAAVGTRRTRDGGTLLISEPQLGYSYPLLLVEYEIHGAGFDARGTSVPILPTVGIGYTPYTAWALTTGYSKTIDSFIETLCSTAQIAAHTCNANEYFHNGAWKPMSCRDEVVSYRASQKGVPVGPALQSVTVPVCRTVHGPVVARDDEKGRARSVSYAMFGREVETIEGIRLWNKAKTFAEFAAGAAKVTWNENVTVATKDGHIAYFHPGLIPARSAKTDMRLPIPGTGDYDFGSNLPFEQLPHAIDPQQGFLFNWNTKPAYGWLDGEGMGSTSRPGGPGQRGTNIREALAECTARSFSDLKALDRRIGTTDPRAREYLPVIQAFRASATLDAVQKGALDRMLAWDRKHYDDAIDIGDAGAKDSVGATLFDAYVRALRRELFGALDEDVIDLDSHLDCGRGDSPTTIYSRVSGVGSHLFDQSVMDNVVLRVLEPSTSSLAIRRDWTGGRTRDAVMKAALAEALENLAASFTGGTPLTVDTLDQCRRVHPHSTIGSLTGAIGPGSDVASGNIAPLDGVAPLTSCVTMPYQDRGSWVHRVGFEKP